MTEPPPRKGVMRFIAKILGVLEMELSAPKDKAIRYAIAFFIVCAGLRLLGVTL